MSSPILSRRAALATGAAALLSASAPFSAFASAKAPGEVRVIYLGGDFWHNPVTQEIAWRRVLGPAGWRLLFAQQLEALTPDVLAQTDLLIVCRYGTPTDLVWDLTWGNLTLGFSPDRLVEDRPTPSPFPTDEFEGAVIENVRRGMGLLAIHCTVWNAERPKFMDLLGVAKPIMHTIVQPAHIHNLNPTHPITRGIEPFDTGDDEIFNAELKPGASELLFNTSGDEQKITAMGGWCREEGKGRVVALLPGHTQGPYMQIPYNEIMWRASHWALGKTIRTSHLKSWVKK
jgi:type 1 glutamine amidotransferase